MSALGQKQACAAQNRMSALPPKADTCSALAHVRFGPIADSCAAQKRSLFDDLISDGEHTRRNSEADRLCGREVYYELEFGGLQHRQVGGLGALEYVTAVDADLTKNICEVDSVAHQTAGFHWFTDPVSRRNPVARCQSSKLYAAADQESIASDEKGIGVFLGKGRKGRLDLADRGDIVYLDLQSHVGSGFLQ